MKNQKMTGKATLKIASGLLLFFHGPESPAFARARGLLLFGLLVYGYWLLVIGYWLVEHSYNKNPSSVPRALAWFTAVPGL